MLPPSVSKGLIMSVSQILIEIMNVFNALGLTTYMQAGIILALAVSLVGRFFGRGGD